MTQITAAVDWWESFFHGIALDLWRAAVTEEATVEQAEFLAETLDVPTGSSVLDVPCGNGRLALALAARGYRLTGVDIASEFIDEARSRGPDIRWICGDMRQLPQDNPFDGAYCWGNSFGYLDDRGNADFVDAVGRCLRPGARFILENGAIAETLFAQLEDEKTFEIGDIRMDIRNHYDARRGRLHTEYTFARDGESETKTGSQRVYTAGEVCRMLEHSGFEVETLYGGVDRQPFAIGSPHLIAVARKKGADPSSKADSRTAGHTPARSSRARA